MEEIIKIVGIGLIALVIAIILKQYRPEYTIYVSIVAGILILMFTMNKITGIINLLKSISDKTYINKQFLSILLKITGIAIITEFAVSICTDVGEKAIASKIEIGSKLIRINNRDFTMMWGINMKKIILIFILVLMIPTKVLAETEEEIMASTQEKFNISGFINQAQEYTGDFFKDMDLSDIFTQAVQGKVNNQTIYKKIIKILGNEVNSNIKILISILVIIVIHGILKSITDSLENSNVSQIIYFVQYILIVTLIMSNFTEIIKLIKETANNLVGFINLLMPLLRTLMVYTGNITTSTVLEPILLFISNFIGNIIVNVLIPIVLIIVVFSIISKISDRVQVEKISKFLKSGVVWFLGVVLTIFVGVVSLEGTLSSSVDGITAKTAKAAVSSVIPVVGKVLGDVVDSVLGCGVILKNAVGVVEVIVIIGICIFPVLKIATLSIMYSLASAVVQPVADDKIVKLLDEMSGVFKLLLAILCSLSVILIIGVTLVIKISNSGMMYR